MMKNGSQYSPAIVKFLLESPPGDAFAQYLTRVTTMKYQRQNVNLCLKVWGDIIMLQFLMAWLVSTGS